MLVCELYVCVCLADRLVLNVEITHKGSINPSMEQESRDSTSTGGTETLNVSAVDLSSFVNVELDVENNNYRDGDAAERHPVPTITQGMRLLLHLYETVHVRIFIKYYV